VVCLPIPHRQVYMPMHVILSSGASSIPLNAHTRAKLQYTAVITQVVLFSNSAIAGARYSGTVTTSHRLRLARILLLHSGNGGRKSLVVACCGRMTRGERLTRRINIVLLFLPSANFSDAVSALRICQPWFRIESMRHRGVG
jgi:hypothetical protein